MRSLGDLQTWLKSAVRPDRIADAISWLRHEIVAFFDVGTTGTISLNAGATGWSLEVPAFVMLGLAAGITVALLLAAVAAVVKTE